MALIATTAPLSSWPPQTQPLGPTDAPPYLIRVVDARVKEFLGLCARTGHRAEEAANVFEAGAMMEEMRGRP